MTEHEEFNGIGLAVIGSLLLKQEIARQRFNERLLKLHSQLVVELRKTSERVDLLRQREEALRMARDGLLQLEAMGVSVVETSPVDLEQGECG